MGNLQAARSRQGKMEKSFLTFVSTYPTWEPGAAAKQMLASLDPRHPAPPAPGFPYTSLYHSPAGMSKHMCTCMPKLQWHPLTVKLCIYLRVCVQCACLVLLLHVQCAPNTIAIF